MSFQQARNTEDVQDEYEPSRLEAALWRIEELERELAECLEKLAAAEAAIRGVEYFNSYGMAQCPFCRAVLPYSHTVDCITQQPMTALDAALEQARQEGKEKL